MHVRIAYPAPASRHGRSSSLARASRRPLRSHVGRGGAVCLHAGYDLWSSGAHYDPVDNDCDQRRDHVDARVEPEHLRAGMHVGLGQHHQAEWVCGDAPWPVLDEPAWKQVVPKHTERVGNAAMKSQVTFVTSFPCSNIVSRSTLGAQLAGTAVGTCAVPRCPDAN